MIIAIDYDGTISDTNRSKVQWIEVNLGIVVSPWACNRTDCVPIIGAQAYERMGAYVYERESTLKSTEVEGALDGLRILSSRASLHVVTARPERRVAYAREWLEEKNVLSCFDGIHSSAGVSKAEVCATIDAGALIDDDIRHLEPMYGVNLHRILLQQGREKRSIQEPEIKFCSSWREVLNVII